MLFVIYLLSLGCSSIQKDVDNQIQQAVYINNCTLDSLEVIRYDKPISVTADYIENIKYLYAKPRVTYERGEDKFYYWENSLRGQIKQQNDLSIFIATIDFTESELNVTGTIKDNNSNIFCKNIVKLGYWDINQELIIIKTLESNNEGYFDISISAEWDWILIFHKPIQIDKNSDTISFESVEIYTINDLIKYKSKKL